MNHPHEPQAAAMDRAGELPDGEQLRSGNLCEKCKCADWCAEHGCWALTECINSGQASAAQVVAHAEAGELPPLPRPAVHAFADISESFLRADHYTAAQMHAHATAALAAERAEVARLREALNKSPDWHDLLSQLVEALDGAFISSWQSTAAWQKELNQALAALNQKATS